MNEWTPRIESVEIPKDKIGEIIGPKGAVIRELEEQTGASIEIEEADGKGIVRIASSDGAALAAQGHPPTRRPAARPARARLTGDTPCSTISSLRAALPSPPTG